MSGLNIDNHLVGARFTHAVESADADAMRAIFAADATAWYNYRGPEGLMMSSEDAIANILGMRRHVEDFRYVHASRVPTETGYFQISRIRCVTKKGTVLDLPVALDADVNAEGRITAYREWIDSKDLRPFLVEMQG